MRESRVCPDIQTLQVRRVEKLQVQGQLTGSYWQVLKLCLFRFTLETCLFCALGLPSLRLRVCAAISSFVKTTVHTQ